MTVTGFPTDPMPYPPQWRRTPDFPDDPDPWGMWDHADTDTDQEDQP